MKIAATESIYIHRQELTAHELLRLFSALDWEKAHVEGPALIRVPLVGDGTSVWLIDDNGELVVMSARRSQSESWSQCPGVNNKNPGLFYQMAADQLQDFFETPHGKGVRTQALEL